jgi:ABC-type uncharacterized transport system ATPase subunit
MIEKSYKWIIIRKVRDSKTGKTKIFNIINKKNSYTIGEIKWNGGWKEYCFYPAKKSFYEETCLRDIAGFLEELKKKKKLKNENS